jgi:hypothetical protein
VPRSAARVDLLPSRPHRGHRQPGGSRRRGAASRRLAPRPRPFAPTGARCW